MRSLLLTSALVLPFAACGLKVTSTQIDGVPPPLLGEWRGEWESNGTQGGGAIEVRVQQYEQQPVVSVVLDNPCIVPQTYELFFVGAGIELRAQGSTVLRAELGEDGELVGVYDCAADSGTWSAVREGDLPEILDLSGEWLGTVDAVSGGDDLLMSFEQLVLGGTVRLQGTLQLPEFMPVPLPVVGSVRFREDDFEVVLLTTAGVLPAIQMIGVGDAETFMVDDGVMIVSGGALVPFSSAVWTATPAPE